MERNITAQNVIEALEAYANPRRAISLLQFFKTGKGQYGEGDQFMGAMVPEQRLVSRQFRDLPHKEVVTLLMSHIHEHRLTALMILCLQYDKAKSLDQKKAIITLYLEHTSQINNWDLVDCSAAIVGKWDSETGDTKLRRLSQSKMLWEQRISIVGTWPMIKVGKLALTLEISERLLSHPHDLIHKAVGWMLREVGKKDEKVLVCFLDSFAAVMPRTMLRYSIERFPEEKRQYYLKLKK
jgi:3-methyladenine DNA glycosylase AlkD